MGAGPHTCGQDGGQRWDQQALSRGSPSAAAGSDSQRAGNISGPGPRGTRSVFPV
jgi:hypothetical protein